jgi:tetratricopeptide (TPR) repeat protein
LTKALEIAPQYAEAYHARGILRETSGDLTGALADYDQTLQFDPENADAYLYRGRTYLRAGKELEARKDFDQFLKRKPDQQAEIDKVIAEARQKGK